MTQRPSYQRLIDRLLGNKSIRARSNRPALSSLNFEVLEPRQLLAAVANGWVGSYFPSSTPNSSPTLVRHDAIVDFDWGERSGLNGAIDSDGTSARWESNLQSDHTATHQLIVRTNPLDGVRVWANNQLVIDAWSGAGAEQLTADVVLVANQSTSLKIEYVDLTGVAKIWLGWTSPQLPIEVLGPEWTPLSQSQRSALDNVAVRGTLFEQLSNVAGDYLDTGDVDPIDVASGVRLTTIQADSSSSTFVAQKMRGFIVPQVSGDYQFRISGGSQNRLLLADDATPELARVIASTTTTTTPGQWNVQSTQTSGVVSLVEGLQFYFEARQTSSGSYDGLEVQWRQDGSSWVTIDNDQLRPLQAEVGVRAVVSAVNETHASATLSIDVSRTDDFGRAVGVNLDYGGTATRDSDYTGALPTVTIPVGQRSARMDITVASDSVDEVLETIKVGAASSQDYQLTTPIRARTTLSIFGNLVPAGSSLIASDPLTVSNIDQTTGPVYASFTNRTANGENGGTIIGTVLVVGVTSTPANGATATARWIVNQDVSELETVYAEFYYRRTGTPWVPVDFEIQDTASSDAWGRTQLTAKGFWQRAQLPITPGESLSNGSIRVELLFGLKQNADVEIANFEVKRFVSDIANSAPILPADAGSLSHVDLKSGQGTYATFTDRTTTAAEQVPFNNVLNVDVHTSASFLSQIGAGWYSDIAIDSNSIITAEVWLRTDDAPFDVRLQIEQPTAVNRNLLKEDLAVTGQWTKHQLSLTAREASDAGDVRFEAIFGRSLGTLEIGGIQLWNHGSLPDLYQFLPQGSQSYAEREADSNWRWEAQQDVLEHRRNEFQVNVTNLAGVPISGATVEVNQLEHAYGFGNIIKTEFISDLGGGQASTDASQRHQAIASRLFNTITIANAIRWVPWDLNRQRGIESVDWVNDNVDSLHGHHLTWGQLSMIPAAVRNEYNQRLNDFGQANAREYLRDAQLAHVADIADELSGTIDGTKLPKIAHWDTVNHPVLIKEIWNILRNGGSLAGPIGEVFVTAKANSNLDTLQMINEGQTIEFVDIPRRTEYYELIEELMTNGKPVEAVGFMNHFGLSQAPSPTQFKAHLDEFAALGLPLGMTEFDINSTGTDLQTQADWSEDYYLNVFANPATSFIIGYGFFELAHWRHEDGAHWYNSNWEAKPNADVFVDQIHRQWQTHTTGSTRTDGSYRTMAFDGMHQVTVVVDGQTYQATAKVDANGGVVNVQIDVPKTVTNGTRIQAEGYDLGGQDVAYFDTTLDNIGGDFRIADYVDIQTTTDTGGGYNVGWIATGEWLHYTADVDAGIYDIDFRVAANTVNTKSVEILIANDAASSFTSLGMVNVVSTGGFQNWATVTLEDVDMSDWAGADRVFRLEFVGSGFNLNWFEFSLVPSAVVGRGVAYGGANAAYGADAIDPSKEAFLYLPGQTATGANYTNYTRGLNRLVVDMTNLPTTSLSDDDFVFRVGNTSDPSQWDQLSASSTIPLPTISFASGPGGSDRLILDWPNNAIQNNWLQVTIKATDNTGLATDDVFYFGNQIADVFGTTTANAKVRVNASDTFQIRLNQSPAPNSAAIENVYDINRSGSVNASDTFAARLNQVPTGGLLMLSAPAKSLLAAQDLGFTRALQTGKRSESTWIDRVVELEARVPQKNLYPNRVKDWPTESSKLILRGMQSANLLPENPAVIDREPVGTRPVNDSRSKMIDAVFADSKHQLAQYHVLDPAKPNQEK